MYELQRNQAAEAVNSAPPAAVTRTKKPGGSPYSGRPLQISDSLAQKIRDSFGIDAGELSLRESPEVAQMGTRATAQGNAIRFAPGQFRPDTRGGMEMLGHELSHVREQATSSIKANMPGNIHLDSAHESASDRAGQSFASGTMSAASPVSVSGMSAHSAPVQGFDLKKMYNKAKYSFARSKGVQALLGGMADRQNTGEFNDIYNLKVKQQKGEDMGEHDYGDMTYKNKSDQIAPGYYDKLTSLEMLQNRQRLDKEMNAKKVFTGEKDDKGNKLMKTNERYDDVSEDVKKQMIEPALLQAKSLAGWMNEVDGLGMESGTEGINTKGTITEINGQNIGSGQAAHSYDLMSSRLGKKGGFWDLVRQKQADKKFMQYDNQANLKNKTTLESITKQKSSGENVSGNMIGSFNELLKSGGNTTLKKMFKGGLGGKAAKGFDTQLLRGGSEKDRNESMIRGLINKQPKSWGMGSSKKSGGKLVMDEPTPVYDGSTTTADWLDILQDKPKPTPEPSSVPTQRKRGGGILPNTGVLGPQMRYMQRKKDGSVGY